MAIEIVDLPYLLLNMVIFQFAMLIYQMFF